MNGGVFLSLCDTKGVPPMGKSIWPGGPLCPRHEDNITPPFMGAVL